MLSSEPVIFKLNTETEKKETDTQPVLIDNINKPTTSKATEDPTSITRFEKNLFSRISTNNSPKVKKIRIAMGSEVITSDEVLDRLKAEQKQKQEKELIREQKRKNYNSKRILKERNKNKTIKNKKNTKAKNIKREIDSSEESHMSWQSESSDSETEVSAFFSNLLEENEEEKTIEEIENVSEINNITYPDTNALKELDTENIKGKWILVKFASKKSIKHFIGQVMESTNDILFKTKFVRKVSGLKSENLTFTYPTVEDIYNVSVPDIISILPTPIEGRRGTLKFNVCFKDYNIQ